MKQKKNLRMTLNIFAVLLIAAYLFGIIHAEMLAPASDRGLAIIRGILLIPLIAYGTIYLGRASFRSLANIGKKVSGRGGTFYWTKGFGIAFFILLFPTFVCCLWVTISAILHITGIH
jgi:ABC-type molybdate transport system permease subunit